MEVEAKMLEADEHESDKRSVFGFTTHGHRLYQRYQSTDVSDELLSNINVSSLKEMQPINKMSR